MEELLRRTMRRRDVLKLGAAAGSAVVVNVSDLLSLGRFNTVKVAAAFVPSAASASAALQCAIGYCVADDAMAGASPDGFAPNLIAAHTLRGGDSRFVADGATLRVHGVFPERHPETWADLASVSIDVSFAPFHDAPFHAWTFTNSPVRSHGGAALFRVPVDAAGGLNLTVNTRRVGAATTQTVARWTVGDEAGAAKLRAGYYVVPVGVDSASHAWDDFQLASLSREGASSPRALYRWSRRAGALVAADLPHIVLSVS